MLSKQDTGVWKVKEEEANNHRRMPKQNAQVCLGHEIKKKCATDIHAYIHTLLTFPKGAFQRQCCNH